MFRLPSLMLMYYILQSIAVEGYEVGLHAPGLKLNGIGGYRAAHNIIRVSFYIKKLFNNEIKEH